jgi:menaquinone-9 beta-reductase
VNRAVDGEPTRAVGDVDLVDVAIVGGGPAGSTLAALLAARGHRVTVLERRAAYAWRACGVFAGPRVRTQLVALGVTRPEIAAMARDVPAMRVETPAGTTVRLTYGADRGGLPAVAFDRKQLDERLLALASERGATVCRGATVTGVGLDDRLPNVAVRGPDGQRTAIRARVVVGADGIRSLVAQAAGVDRHARLARLGITFHVAEAVRGDPPVGARMVVLGDAYCGLAPVPGGRVNVGIVARGRARDTVRRDGAVAGARAILGSIPPNAPGAPAFQEPPEPLDRAEGASPLAHRVTRRAGPAWILVGDAAGFLDPFTGEGLHRSLASAFLAADAIDRRLAGGARALEAYDRAMRGRFAAKDSVSLLVQAFLARPAMFEYAASRLARRDGVRRTLELVLGDLVPASRAFDPRFLGALLAP